MSQDPNFGQAGAAQVQPIPQLNLSSVPTQASQPGGFWIRFVAAIVDSLIIKVVSMPISLLFEIAGKMSGSTAVTVSLAIVSLVLQLVLVFYFYGWFYSKKGATPGKLLMGLKVLDSETGAHLSYKRAFFRETFGKFVSAVTLFVGFIMAGVRNDKKALHDLMFNTQVIRTK